MAPRQAHDDQGIYALDVADLPDPLGPPGERHDVVIAANRLPVRLDGDGGWALSPGGLVTAMTAVMEGRDAVWIGWDGGLGDAADSAPPARFGDMALRSVSLSETDYADYYEGFSNGTLWPLYHNGLLSTRFRRSWWAAYRRVNEQFAKAAIETTEQDGTLWIHDYHLQLMPAFVREARPDIRIGLFLHTPFPPSQLLMRLPWREAITDGLLATDVIGFQTPTDARNFLSLAHRMGRTEEVMPVDPVTEIIVEGRRVAVGSFPISIDVDRIDEMVRDPASREAANAFRESLGSPKHLLLGVDRLDYTKGIDARLKAFEELLRDGMLDPAEVAFVQVATPSRDDVRGYSNTRTEIEQLVGSINGNFAQLGRPVLHYLHQSLPFEDLVHLFLAADVMLVTPFQDGMNLVAKEYIACRTDGTGALVLSEFAGTAVELHQALLCNPFDTAGMKRVIETALTLPVEEQRQRVRAMRTHLWANTVHDWAEGFFRHLDDVHPRGQRG